MYSATRCDLLKNLEKIHTKEIVSLENMLPPPLVAKEKMCRISAELFNIDLPLRGYFHI